MMIAVKILPAPLLAGHRYVLHAGCDWRGKHYTRYRSYPIPTSYDLPDAEAFVYRSSVALGTEKHFLSVQKDLGPETGDPVERPRMKHGSRRSTKSESSDPEPSIFVLKTRNTSENV